MILITTPTGNTGHNVLATAIGAGESVRTLARDPNRIPRALRERCEVITGDLRDEATLRKAAEGARAAFFCVPQSGESTDVAAYYRAFAEPAARAFKAAQVAHLVTISGGRGEPADVGPSGPLAAMEKSIDATGAATRHVRCGYFMENFLYMIPALKFTKSFSLPVAGDVGLSLESASDIARAASRWLLDVHWTGQAGVCVPYGELLSCDAAAATLSRVLDQRIAFKPVTAETYKATLVKYGVSEAMGQSLGEMFSDIAHGSIGSANGAKAKDSESFAHWVQATLKPELGWMRVFKRLRAA
jgi:uncharacterized protein YbjT (DUF2867 family)